MNMLQRVEVKDLGGKVGNRLSYSQSRLYSECGMKYKFHYVDRLREKTKSGALLFGSAVDKAWESLLKHHLKAGNWDFNEYETFDNTWARCEINGKYHDAPTCELIGYGAADFDYELLTSDDLKFLTAKCEEMLPDLLQEKEGNLEAAYKQLAEFRSMNDNKQRKWQGKEYALHNLFNWMSMRRKGYLMLVANREKVLPRIKQVLGAQKAGELTNDNGETVVSYLDLECIWEDGRHVILDYKTSARDYDPDAVLISQQLAIYGYTHSVPNGGYLVFKKQIRKNRTKKCKLCGFNGNDNRAKTCPEERLGMVVKRGKEVEDMVRCNGEWDETITPECVVDVIIDALPQRLQDIVVENLNTINNAISAQVFSRNFNSCKTGYGRCPFFNKCYKDDDSELEKM
jgi:hypothetical protein